jgi:hypothetical protein
MFTIQIDQASLNRVFASMDRQVRFAASLAINRTAQVVRDTLKTEMRTAFDRPTPWTMNSLQITPSTKQRLEAKVWFKVPPRFFENKHYLEPQVYGGGRPFKGAERLLHMSFNLPRGWYALPGPSARLDSYGNMSRGQLVQILSALRSLPAGIGNRPLQYGLTRGSRAPKNQPQFFVIQPYRGSHLSPGVWMRGANRTVKQVLRFVPHVSYRKRFAFFEIAQRVMEQELAGQFDRALQETIATAR